MSENNLKDIWDSVISQIEQEYKDSGKETEFRLWFNMKYVEDNNFTVKVSVPSIFMWKSMVSKGYVDIVKKYFKEITAQDIEIESIVSENEPKKENVPLFQNNSINSNNSDNSDISNNSENVLNSNSSNQKTNFDSFNSNISNISNQNVLNSVGSKTNSAEEKYTFENFIAGDGSSSKFAYNVALSVSQNPGTKRNPVLFYGGVGLGKTHLMKAIGNKIKELYPQKKICYIQSESFLNEFTKSIFNKTQDSFKSKYRKLDVLLLDDIHFLQNKPGIQEELFYTFEALKDKKSQMVFTCDRPLKEIEHMTERLVSRLGSGICLNLDFPSYETRKAIIYKNLQNEEKTLPEDIIDYIAKIIETNIRDLESALTKIIGYAEFFDSPITLDIAKEQLQDFYSAPKVGNVSVQNIMKIVASNFQITLEDMKSSKRQQKFVNPRHIALYICHELTEYTYTELGNEFGGRDHSSIMHAVEKVEEKIKTDSNTKQMINLLIKEIKENKN